MSKKTDYNKGVVSGLKVAQKVIEQEVEAMDYLKSRVDLIVEGHDEMKSAVNQLIKDADENAIINLFGVCNEAEPRDLKEHEKKVLLNILATLGSVQINDDQRKYYNNLRHHLNIQGYAPVNDYDFRSIESLESVRSIKIIAKAVRIFLYLQDCNMDGVYRHEDDLFSYFELRSFDEIDASIELLVYLFGKDGLIEIYGDFGQASESERKNLGYLNVTEKENIDISNECAQIYFKDCYIYDKGVQYIESSSYVIYSNRDKIIKLHKKTGVQNVLLDHIENAGEFIEKRKIATFSDMGYYVLGNDLYYIDLDSQDSGFIFHINEEKDSDNKTYEVMGLCVYKSQKLIYENGLNYVVDLEIGMETAHRFSIGSETNNYYMHGDYLYFVDMDNNLDDLMHTKYVLKRYGILNDQTTTVSKTFGKRVFFSKREIYEVISEGMYGQYYYCVFGYKSATSNDRVGFDCFYINTDDDERAEAHRFYIWDTCIYQIEQYKGNLIYVNADKDFSLISHDFITDKKRVLIKKYGETEKVPFYLRWFLGKSGFQKSDKYMRLGKWIWTCKHDKQTPEIISI